MQKRPATRLEGPAARSAAERTSPAAAVAQRVVRIDHRPAGGNLHQLAAVVRAGSGAVASRRGQPAPGRSAPVVQRLVRIGTSRAYTEYTEVADVADAVAHAKKAGVDLTAVIPTLTHWLDDGRTHGYATWEQFARAAHAVQVPALLAPLVALADSHSEFSDEKKSPRVSSPRAPDSRVRSNSDADSEFSDEKKSPRVSSRSAPDSSARSDSDAESDSGAEEAAPHKARVARRSESSAPRPRKLTAVKMQPSTINVSQNTLLAASALNINAKRLKSRKPHRDTSTGGGGGGTDHDRADGQAAVRMNKIVAEKIKKKTGANVTPKAFVHGLARASEAAAARSEKSEDGARATVEALEGDVEARLEWLAHLAPAEWREKQAAYGNNVRPAPPAKKAKKLAALAPQKGWPQVWDDKYGKDLYR
jgi:hypothetical protein